jgi:hypothetical protein
MVKYIPMKTLALLSIGLFLPFQAVALEYRNLSLLYTDAPFTPAEAAGISLLTSLNAISGNPDGTFRPNRTVNRAEFMKIVLSSYPKIRVSSSDAGNCFRDVSRDDWFSPYVCLGKKRGMVSGYADGEFKPNQSVNYAEALKILGELYDYVAYSADDEQWYAGYVRAATYNKTALPMTLKYDRSLTRGQMARLAAAYRAHHDEELDTYRMSEKNLDLVITQEIAERAEQARSSAAASSESSSSAPVVVEDEFTMPATSHFLMIGSRELIASGFFQPRSERISIDNVTVKFRTEPKNIRTVYLVDAEGTRIAELKPDTYDNADLTWKAQGEYVQRYSVPAEGKELGIEAVLQDRSNGFAEELIAVKWMSIGVTATGGSNSYQLIAASSSYPAHQTVQARIAEVKNNMPPVVDLSTGENVLLGEVEVSGDYLEGAELRLNHMTFTITTRDGVQVSDFMLGAAHSVGKVQCSLGDSTRINCLNIPASVGMIENGSVILQLRGDMIVSDSVADPMLRIDLINPGSISTTINPGKIGDIRWSDGTGTYNWIELSSPIMQGSEWK